MTTDLILAVSLSQIIDRLHVIFQNLVLDALGETLYMVGISVLIAGVLGILLGLVLTVTNRGGVLENLVVYKILSVVVNVVRSVPFILLMVFIIPFTRLLVGRFIGTTAAIVPLSFAATPFVARLMETAFREVDNGVVEAALAMGATPFQIIVKVLIPEALPGIIAGITLTAVNLVGYSAMAGAIGGGGLGDVAIRYGYHRYDMTVMAVIVVVLILMVQLIQFVGDFLVKRVTH